MPYMWSIVADYSVRRVHNHITIGCIEELLHICFENGVLDEVIDDIE